MSKWEKVALARSDKTYCSERHVMVVERHPDGRPAVWVEAVLRVDPWGYVTFWETTLATPRTGPERWTGDDTDFVNVDGADRRAECVGKTREQLAEMFSKATDMNNRFTATRTGNRRSLSASEFEVKCPDGNTMTVWSPPWHEMSPDEEEKWAIRQAKARFRDENRH